ALPRARRNHAPSRRRPRSRVGPGMPFPTRQRGNQPWHRPAPASWRSLMLRRPDPCLKLLDRVDVQAFPGALLAVHGTRLVDPALPMLLLDHRAEADFAETALEGLEVVHPAMVVEVRGARHERAPRGADDPVFRMRLRVPLPLEVLEDGLEEPAVASH